MDTRGRNQYFNTASPHQYLLDYSKTLLTALERVDKKAFDDVAGLLEVSRDLERRIFVAGNGGSAALAEHLECDFHKGCEHGNTLNTRSLVSNTSLMTAIANDIGYSQVFKYQLQLQNPKVGEVLILISSSGNSENILQAAQFGLDKKMTIVGLTGFDGGSLKKMAHHSLHVPIHNYGIVEDCHQALFHALAQYHYLSLEKHF